VSGRATCPHHIDADVISFTLEINTPANNHGIYEREMPEVNGYATKSLRTKGNNC
jgi:hypothetical protein